MFVLLYLSILLSVLKIWVEGQVIVPAPADIMTDLTPAFEQFTNNMQPFLDNFDTSIPEHKTDLVTMINKLAGGTTTNTCYNAQLARANAIDAIPAEIAACAKPHMDLMKAGIIANLASINSVNIALNAQLVSWVDLVEVSSKLSKAQGIIDYLTNVPANILGSIEARVVNMAPMLKCVLAAWFKLLDIEMDILEEVTDCTTICGI